MLKPKLLSVCFCSRKEARNWTSLFYRSYDQPDIPVITHLSSKPAVWRLNIPESVQELGYTFFTAEGRYPLKAVGFNHEIIVQRNGLTFGNLTAETAERIGFDAAPPSLADDVQAIRALLVDAPPETPDTTPEALRYGADSTEAAELAYAFSRVLALLKEVSLNSAEVQTAISIASNALGITGHPPIHTRDSDCTIDPQTGCCTVCGVEHREPCPDCGHTAFHSAGCWLDKGHSLCRPAI